jgi:hypothetical protein
MLEHLQDLLVESFVSSMGHCFQKVVRLDA